MSETLDSHFINGLIAARVTPDGCYALRNNQLAIHYTNKETDKQIVRTVAELRKTLEDIFLLAIPGTPNQDAIFQALLKEA